MRNVLTVVLSVYLYDRPSTVFEIAANIAWDNPNQFESIPLYETVREFIDGQRMLCFCSAVAHTF